MTNIPMRQVRQQLKAAGLHVDSVSGRMVNGWYRSYQWMASDYPGRWVLTVGAGDKAAEYTIEPFDATEIRTVLDEWADGD